MIAANVARPAPHETLTSSIPALGAPPSAERRRAFQREERRDFAGVALSVAAGAVVWLVFLSLAHLTV